MANENLNNLSIVELRYMLEEIDNYIELGCYIEDNSGYTKNFLQKLLTESINVEVRNPKNLIVGNKYLIFEEVDSEIIPRLVKLIRIENKDENVICDRNYTDIFENVNHRYKNKICYFQEEKYDIKEGKLISYMDNEFGYSFNYNCDRKIEDLENGLFLLKRIWTLNEEKIKIYYNEIDNTTRKYKEELLREDRKIQLAKWKKMKIEAAIELKGEQIVCTVNDKQK